MCMLSELNRCQLDEQDDHPTFREQSEPTTLQRRFHSEIQVFVSAFSRSLHGMKAIKNINNHNNSNDNNNNDTGNVTNKSPNPKPYQTQKGTTLEGLHIAQDNPNLYNPYITLIYYSSFHGNITKVLKGLSCKLLACAIDPQKQCLNKQTSPAHLVCFWVSLYGWLSKLWSLFGYPKY